MIKQIFGKLPRKSSKSSQHNSNDRNRTNNYDGGVGGFSSLSSSVNSNPTHNSKNSSASSKRSISNPNPNSGGGSRSSSNGSLLPQSNPNSNSNANKPGNQQGKKGIPVGAAAVAQPAPALSSTPSYEALPCFRDVPASEKGNLFIMKLNLCCVVFDFTDPSKSLREKDIKRQTLLELVDYVGSVTCKFNEVVVQEITKMVAANLFRSFPSNNHRDMKAPDIYDPEEEEPAMEPAWPHLQTVYEFLLRFVASSETDAKLAKRYIDQSFVLRLLDLFDSEDQREREYLKTILHRIYGKFMVHRPFIRKSINNIFYRFIFETEKHNGIAELLEILGSIINGFALPLKEEHKLFLVRALIPLHKPKCLALYHQQLSYCITQFVEKDFKLADTVIRGLLKYWPITNSSKEVMFLSELEEVLETTQAAEFQRCMIPLFRKIGRCLSSSHFQVAERTLFLWNNDHIRNLITQNRKVILPIIFPALEKNMQWHWNRAVQSLTFNVRKTFSDIDQELFDECFAKFVEDDAKEKETQDKRELTWKQLEDVAASKAINNEAVVTLRCTSSVARRAHPQTAIPGG